MFRNSSNKDGLDEIEDHVLPESKQYLAVTKFLNPVISLTNRPAFFIALTLMIIGTQLFLAGFIGELISRSSANRNLYLVEEKLGL